MFSAMPRRADRVAVTIDLPRAQRDRLKELAESRERSMGAEARLAMKAYLEREAAEVEGADA